MMDELRASIAHYYRDMLGLPDWEARTERRITRSFDTYGLAMLEKHAGIVKGKRVLDVGCGWGAMMLELVEHGCDLNIGIEPDTERLVIAQKSLAKSRATVLQAVGEHLPFASNCFDQVVCHEVLEHTQNPEHVVVEIERILRPGGTAHILTPNYMSFYEPHYKVVWLPLMPKVLGRLYLKLRGRNPDFINHIRYVNPVFLNRCFTKHQITYVNVGLQNTTRRIEQLVKRVLDPALLSFPIHLVAWLYTTFIHREQHLLIIKPSQDSDAA